MLRITPGNFVGLPSIETLATPLLEGQDLPVDVYVRGYADRGDFGVFIDPRLPNGPGLYAFLNRQLTETRTHLGLPTEHAEGPSLGFSRSFRIRNIEMVSSIAILAVLGANGKVLFGPDTDQPPAVFVQGVHAPAHFDYQRDDVVFHRAQYYIVLDVDVRGESLTVLPLTHATALHLASSIPIDAVEKVLPRVGEWARMLRPVFVNAVPWTTGQVRGLDPALRRTEVILGDRPVWVSFDNLIRFYQRRW